MWQQHFESTYRQKVRNAIILYNNNNIYFHSSEFKTNFENFLRFTREDDWLSFLQMVEKRIWKFSVYLFHIVIMYLIEKFILFKQYSSILENVLSSRNLQFLQIQDYIWGMISYAYQKDLIVMLKTLHHHGFDLNSPHIFKPNLFLQASNKNKLKIVKFCMEAGIDQTDKDGNTGMLCAVKSCSKDVVEYFMKKDYKIDSANNLGVTPISRAASKGFFPIVRLLLTMKASIDYKNMVTALSRAMAKARKEVKSRNRNLIMTQTEDVIKILLKNDVSIHMSPKMIHNIIHDFERGRRTYISHLIGVAAFPKISVQDEPIKNAEKLQILCRTKIRDVILKRNTVKNLFAHIHKLPLPKSIQEMLLDYECLG